MKLAVFDLDGTLIDSLADIAEAANYAMRNLKLPEHELSKFNYMVGDGVKRLIERSLPEDKQAMFNDALKLYNDYYDKNYTVKTYVYDGITETLKNLKNNGILLAVASNKTHGFTENIIHHYFGDELFSIVCGKSDERPVKPDPAILTYIMKNLNVKPEDSFMIGDTCIDIKTGKNAGMKTLGCLWGFRTREELCKAEADFIAENPCDIIKYIC